MKIEKDRDMAAEYIWHMNLEDVTWRSVASGPGFWQDLQQRTRNVTLKIEYEQLERTGRLDSLRCDWKEGNPKKPHFFWDSDIAKWIEAASYSLGQEKDSELEGKVDEIVDLIAAAQKPDGYFNVYFTVVEPGKRFTNLKEKHELYCLGHLIEAAVAWQEATGKTDLLAITSKYADYICERFGTAPGQIRGYDGHPEIELALVKLYRATGDRKYLALCEFFVDERGREPSFFIQECERRGQPPAEQKHRNDPQGTFAYYQAHRPIREQTAVVGHAVRAMYLYSGMADLVAENSDRPLYETCNALWDDLVQRKMYITGGIGQNPKGERFTYEYDLPNDTAYNETCASIGLFFFAFRMMKLRPSGAYGDVMERCLYNTILGGASGKGDRFFYSNPLATHPLAYRNRGEDQLHITLGRQEWFDVACCPPNFARLMLSLNGYIYLKGNDSVFVNLYVNSETQLHLGECACVLRQESDYPWKPDIRFRLSMSRPGTFALHFRIPAWSGRFALLVNGAALEAPEVQDGFARVHRTWHDGDFVELRLDMHVRKTEARPEVSADCGRIALERGPIVYCFEEADNGGNLDDLTLGNGVIHEKYDPDLPGGIVKLTMEGTRRAREGWAGSNLYREKEEGKERVTLTAIPFYGRHNRSLGEMLVWIRSQD
jgi:DUF1680 family protein